MTIQITGKDKMCLLDGSVGGMLTSLTNFASIEQETSDGIEIIMVVIWDIIYEALTHLGGEKPENIIIADLPREARRLLRYMGEEDIYIFEKDGEYSYKFESEIKEEDLIDSIYTIYSYGELIGEEPIPFVWTDPNGLTLNAGESIVSLLQKICQLLTNYEFFYDVYGKFIFQEKKNYLNSTSSLIDINVENYVQTYSKNKVAYSLEDEETLVSIQKNPKYENIKNDFVVWGTRKNENGQTHDIRYRLTIDNKPPILLANQYMYSITKNNINIIYKFYSKEENKTFEEFDQEIKNNLIEEFGDITVDDIKLIGKPTNEWREELYRQILTNEAHTYQAYEMDMLEEWRKLFDTMNEKWIDGWNPKIKTDPHQLDYWIDFIDSRSEISQYSVNSIGRRTKAQKSNSAKAIYYNQPNMIYILFDPADEKKQYYHQIGQAFFAIGSEHKDKFSISAIGSSCWDEIRELLYQHLVYQSQVTINCVPEYYLEPNTLVYIENQATKINGNYVISSFNLPLTYQGTMSVQTTEALTRI